MKSGREAERNDQNRRWFRSLALVTRLSCSGRAAGWQLIFGFLSLVMALLRSDPVVAATYYVTPTGDDTASGLKEAPWKTLTKAANTAVAGDIVRVQPGTFKERVLIKNSGTVQQRIDFRGSDSQRTVIDGTGIAISPGDGLVELRNKHFVWFTDFKVINSAGVGILVQGGAQSHDLEIERNVVENTADSGIRVEGNGDSDRARRIAVLENDISKARVIGARSAPIGALDIRNGVEEFEVWHNVLHDSEIPGVVASDGVSNGRIFGNEERNSTNFGIIVDAWDSGADRIGVFRNFIHDKTAANDSNGGGILAISRCGGELKHLQIYDNVIANLAGCGLWLNYSAKSEVPACEVWKGPGAQPEVEDISVINNVIFKTALGSISSDGGLAIREGIKNVVVRNNIVSQNASFQIVSLAADAVIEKNLIDGYAGFPNETRGVNWIEGDPQFVAPAINDFHLRGSSPAIDAGSALGAPVIDFEGNFRPEGAGHDIGAFEFNPRGEGCGDSSPPAPWRSQDVGAVTKPGCASHDRGVFTLLGSGADIWDHQDAFHFVYQTLKGDADIVARVAAVEATDWWVKAGVMLRATLDAGSVHAMMVITPGQGSAFQFRSITGDHTVHVSGGYVLAPIWVRLARRGNTLIGYTAADGENWKPVGMKEISMPEQVFAGLVVDSAKDGVLCTAVIEGVRVGAPPEPVIPIGRATAPPVLDGNLEEFHGAPPIEIVQPLTGAIGSYRLLWDDLGLYVGVSVGDRFLDAELAKEDGDLWTEDSLEISFDTSLDAGTLNLDDFKFFVNLLNVHHDARGKSGTTYWDSSWDMAFSSVVAIDGTLGDDSDFDLGYRIEVSIPWSSWGIQPPVVGTTWGLEVVLDDRVGDNQNQRAWATPVGKDCNDPDNWGEAIFSGPICKNGTDDCGGLCVDLQTSPVHCGACGQSCAPDKHCVRGRCSPNCGPGTEPQGDVCVAAAGQDCACATNSFFGFWPILIFWGCLRRRSQPPIC